MKLDESIKNYDYAGDVTPVVTSTEATAIEVSKDKQKKKDEIIPDFRDVDPTPGSDKAEKPEKVEFPKLELDESLFDEPSEMLTEELDEYDYDKFQSEVYNALANIARKYAGKGVEEKCFDKAFEWFTVHFFEDEFEEACKSDTDASLTEDVFDKIKNAAMKAGVKFDKPVAEKLSLDDFDDFDDEETDTWTRVYNELMGPSEGETKAHRARKLKVKPSERYSDVDIVGNDFRVYGKTENDPNFDFAKQVADAYDLTYKVEPCNRTHAKANPDEQYMLTIYIPEWEIAGI